MIKLKKILFIFFIFYNHFLLAENNIILTGTTMLTSLVNDVVDNEYEIITLIPESQCPSSFDLKPEDVKKIKNSKLVLLHGFQKRYYDKIKKINKEIRIEYLNIYDLTIPENYYFALYEIKNILTKYKNSREKEYDKNIKNKIKTIKEYIKKDLKFIENLKNKEIKVLCSRHQENFSKWLGFKIVGIFLGPDVMSIKDINNLIKIAKKEKVKFIISNLAGNHNETAIALNKNLNIPIIVFSNFPEIRENKSLFLNLWDYNISNIKRYLQ